MQKIKPKIVRETDKSPIVRDAGLGKGAWRVAPDFDAPLPEDLQSAFEGAS